MSKETKIYQKKIYQKIYLTDVPRMNRVPRQVLCTLLRFYSVMDTTALGTIEYGVAALGVPLIVVMGHCRELKLVLGSVCASAHRSFRERVTPHTSRHQRD
jgi:hypothetical protein